MSWEDEEDAPLGLCDLCESPLVEDRNGEASCESCAPRCCLDYSPVRLSVQIVDGVASWAGWSA